MNELSDKTIIITGASRGIGEAAARHLAGSGANVVLSARSAVQIEAIAEDIELAGGRALPLACDVSDQQAVASLISTTVKHFGRLDVLINNAGLIEPITHLADSDPDAWSSVVDVNLKGVYYGMRYALPVMRKQASGTIINISSGAANSNLEGWSHYCATKAAVLRLTGVAHLENASDGITIVGLSPGTVATDMQIAIKKSGVNPVSRLDPSVHISPEYVAQAIAYLCTDAAKEFAGSDFSLKTDAGRARIGPPNV